MSDVDRAKQLQNQGQSVREIAKQLNVSKSTVGRWLTKTAGAELVVKSFMNPRWETVGGPPMRKVDVFGAIQEPSYEQLLTLGADDVVYLCHNWLSDEVASTALKVYATTSPHYKPKNGLYSDVIKSKSTPDGTTREVLDHAAKRLLDNPNEHMTKRVYLKVVDTQLSLVGNSWTHVHREEMWSERVGDQMHHRGEGLPTALVPLKPQYVKLAYREHEVVGIWYQVETQAVFIPKCDVLWFKLIDPADPFGLGVGPVRGVWERVLNGKSELAYVSSLYRNQARPDSLIQVEDATADQLQRIQKEMNQRFKEGGYGGVWAVDGKSMEVKPLTWSPKDVLGTDLYKWNKTQILNAFKLNDALFMSESSNRATASTARRQAQEYAVEPRLRMIEETLNCKLMPEFDRRLQVGFEIDFVEDADQTLKETTAYLDRGVTYPNEVRTEQGRPSVPWGDQPVKQQAAPQQPKPEGDGGNVEAR